MFRRVDVAWSTAGSAAHQLTSQGVSYIVRQCPPINPIGALTWGRLEPNSGPGGTAVEGLQELHRLGPGMRIQADRTECKPVLLGGEQQLRPGCSIEGK